MGAGWVAVSDQHRPAQLLAPHGCNAERAGQKAEHVKLLS